MNVIATGFVIALIFMAGFMSFILAHEATHLVRSDEAFGICLGRCRYSSPKVDPPTGVAFATAAGKHNEESMDEVLPNFVGLAVMVFVIVAGVFCLSKKEV